MRSNPKTVEKKKKYFVKRSRAGLGLFAVDFFKKGEFVIEYIGERLVGKKADDRYNKYLFEVNSQLTIDGLVRSNVARYINHSCRPNCEVRIYAKRVRIWTIKRIMPGEQFSYDYGKEYFDEYIKPVGCKCASCRKKRKKQKI
jgi:SET domain-containing protein